MVDVIDTTTESASVLLSCGQNRPNSPVSYILENQDTTQQSDFAIECEGIISIPDLSTATDYYIFRQFGDTLCIVNNFTTAKSKQAVFYLRLEIFLACSFSPTYTYQAYICSSWGSRPNTGSYIWIQYYCCDGSSSSSNFNWLTVENSRQKKTIRVNYFVNSLIELYLAEKELSSVHT